VKRFSNKHSTKVLWERTIEDSMNQPVNKGEKGKESQENAEGGI